MLREPICSEKCETLAAGNGNENLPETVITGSEEAREILPRVSVA